MGGRSRIGNFYLQVAKKILTKNWAGVDYPLVLPKALRD